MSALKDYRTISGGFNNKVDYHRFRFTLGSDVGTAGALDITLATENLIIVHAHLKVITAMSTGSSPTLIWGHTDDTDCFMNATQGAAANLTAGAVVVPPLLEGTPNVDATPYMMATNKKLIMTIGTATITTGVFEFVIGVLKA